ncbi:cutinase-domain-containing protein [Pyronema domesticum]|nr:cutinase-domain-containing protein [Pyronema domesticum]
MLALLQLWLAILVALARISNAFPQDISTTIPAQEDDALPIEATNPANMSTTESSEGTDRRTSKGKYSPKDLNNGLCGNIALLFALTTGPKGLYAGPNALDYLTAGQTSENSRREAEIGQKWASALQAQSNDSVIVQSIPYLWPYPGDKNHLNGAAQLVKQAVDQCPDSNIVLSGHGYGARLWHEAVELDLVPNEHCANIKAVMLFGDTRDARPFPGSLHDKIKWACNPSDAICHGGFNRNGFHYEYDEYFAPAAEWVINQVSGISGPSDPHIEVDVHKMPVIGLGPGEIMTDLTMPPELMEHGYKGGVYSNSYFKSGCHMLFRFLGLEDGGIMEG